MANNQKTEKTSTYMLSVSFVLPCDDIKSYDGEAGDVIDRLISTFGGECMGGVFEPVNIPCIDCGQDHDKETIQGRVEDYRFESDSEVLDESWVLDAFHAVQALRYVVAAYVLKMTDDGGDGTDVAQWTIFDEISDDDGISDPEPEAGPKQLN